MNELITTDGSILCEEHPDGVTIVIPAAGIWKSGGFMFFVFCSIWWGLLTFTGLTPWTFRREFPNAEEWAIGFVWLFWACGVAMLFVGFRLGRIYACLAVVGDRFVVRSAGVLRTLIKDWSRQEIHDVHAHFLTRTAGTALTIALEITATAATGGIAHFAASGEEIVTEYSDSFRQAMKSYPSTVGSLRVVTRDKRIHTILEGTQGDRLVRITVALRKALGMN